MTTPTPEALAETLDHAIGVERALIEEQRWLYGCAFEPGRPSRDRPSRILPRDPTGDPDYVPAHPGDIGLGDDRSRNAVTHAGQLVADADRLVLTALNLIAGQRTASEGRPRPVRGEDHTRTVQRTVRRLRWLRDHDVVHGDPEVRRQVAAGCLNLITALATLRAAQKEPETREEAELLSGDRRCNNGDCSNPAQHGKRECAACQQYRLRKGRPRPIRRFAAEHDAKIRREARGEGQARSPLPRQEVS